MAKASRTRKKPAERDEDGYVLSTPYLERNYVETSPEWIAFAALQKGLAPPALDRPFAYLELGCGMGGTINHNAPLYPQARFMGVDINPEHIRHAGDLAARNGANNARFLESSFAELAADPSPLPKADFIVLHGVLSWITERQRALAVQIVGQRLKPGGLVYASYNALPGCTAMLPLRHLMTEWATRLAGPDGNPLDQFPEVLKRLLALREGGAAFFREHQRASKRLDHLAKADIRYVAHEYFNRAWQPFYHHEVAALMAEIGLGYAASTHLLANVDKMATPPPAGGVVRQLSGADPRLAELLRDYAINTEFRRDVFARPAAPLSPAERAAAYGKTVFAARAETFSPQVTIGAGSLSFTATLNAAFIGALFAALKKAGGTATGAEMAAGATGAPLSDTQMVEGLDILAAAGYVIPAPIPPEPP